LALSNLSINWTSHDLFLIRENRYRKHLRAILICALDTGMRRGEILSLKWSDVDFEERVLTIRAFNTKTMKERQVSLTTRLTLELEKLWDASPKGRDQIVFGFTNNVKNSFRSVRTEAGLPEIRFHDLRHTAATRPGRRASSATRSGRVLVTHKPTQPIATSTQTLKPRAEQQRRSMHLTWKAWKNSRRLRQ